MNEDREILESLIVGGVIGAALSAIISKNKDAAGIGAIAGAAILASYRASQRAKQTAIPRIVEENNMLVEIQPGGDKRILKKIPKAGKSLPKHFTLR